jgi:hypothetical protein
MSVKKLQVKVTYNYEIEVDSENPIVEEYESENLLLVDCASYRFGNVLPVIASGGVKINDVQLIEVH